MKQYRAIVWAEEIYPDLRPGAAPDDIIVTRVSESFFIRSTSQDKAVKAFKADLARLAAIKLRPL